MWWPILLFSDNFKKKKKKEKRKEKKIRTLDFSTLFLANILLDKKKRSYMKMILITFTQINKKTMTENKTIFCMMGCTNLQGHFKTMNLPPGKVTYLWSLLEQERVNMAAKCFKKNALNPKLNKGKDFHLNIWNREISFKKIKAAFI